MRDKKEIEELLRKFSEQEEPNPSLAQDAENLAQQLYSNKHVNKTRKFHWFHIGAIMAACCACILIGVLVPVYFVLSPSQSPTKEPTVINYYTDAELDSERLTNLNEFVSGNSIQFRYLPDAQQTTVFYVKETHQPVIVAQQYVYFDNENYDTVDIEICLSKDQFTRLEKFTNFDKQKKLNDDITVYYSISYSSNGCEILALCEADSIRYYWNITSLQGEERLDYYIQFLFAG